MHQLKSIGSFVVLNMVIKFNVSLLTHTAGLLDINITTTQLLTAVKELEMS